MKDLTSGPKASRGQPYPCPALSCGFMAQYRQGIRPDREQCPIEHVYSSIPASVCILKGRLQPSLGWLKCDIGWLLFPASEDVQTYIQTDGISLLFYMTLSPIRSAEKKWFK